MFQRQLGAPSMGFNRQASSELVSSPGGSSRSVSRNNSFSRRAPTGAPCGIPQSRSRTSLLVSCSGPNGPFDEGNSSDASPFSEARPHEQAELLSSEPHNHNHNQKNQRPQPPPLAAGPEATSGPAATSSSSPQHCSPYSRPAHPHPAQARNDQSSTWDFTPEPFVPLPSNLPTEGDVLYPPRSLGSLQKDFWTLTDQPGIDLFRVSPLTWDRLGLVYVILFGVGTRNTEGIYSLRALRGDGSPHETIIAFECEEEAQRYADLLEASMTHAPYVCAIPPRQLLGFCADQTYSCRLEPRGSLLIPPDYTVSVTDWERSMRLREGQFAVLEAEPERISAATAGGGAAATATAPTAAPPGSTGGPGTAGGMNLHLLGISGPVGRHPSNLARYTGPSGDELESVRARLEALLPK